MLRLCLSVALPIILGVAVCAQPAPVPAPVDLPITTTHQYVDPPGIIVSPIAPSVLDKCLRTMLKVPVTWPPDAKVEFPGWHLRCLPEARPDDNRQPYDGWPYRYQAPAPRSPDPAAPPELRLPSWHKR